MTGADGVGIRIPNTLEGVQHAVCMNMPTTQHLHLYPKMKPTIGGTVINAMPKWVKQYMHGVLGRVTWMEASTKIHTLGSVHSRSADKLKQKIIYRIHHGRPMVVSIGENVQPAAV